MEQESLVSQIATLAIENSASSIVVTDPVGILLYVNPYFEAMTGYTLAEVGGRPCSFLQYDPDGNHIDQPGVSELRCAVREGRTCTARVTNFRKSGEQFINEVTISPLRDLQNQVIGFVGVQQDVTERVRSEQALIEAAITQHAMGMLREIFGDFNHEMRHPLSRISVAAHLMRRMTQHNRPEQALEATAAIEQEIGIMRTLLDRFAHLQKLYSYKRHQPRYASIIELIETEITIFFVRHPDVEFEVDFEPDLETISIDVDEMGLMVRELLDNMTVHNPNLPKRVMISVHQQDSTLVMRFSNNGEPIEQEIVDQLFRPFFRGDRSRTADSTRVGLGLSLVARVAEIHGGRVYLENTGAHGSTFTVQIPLSFNPQENPEVRMFEDTPMTKRYGLKHLDMTGS